MRGDLLLLKRDKRELSRRLKETDELIGFARERIARLFDDGTSRETGDLNGYSIVEADSLEVARELADNHPFLTEGKGRFAVEVFELVPM